MKKNFWHKILKSAVLLVVSIFAICEHTEAYASEIGSEPYITVSAYEVPGGEIIPGQEFTVTFVLQNADQVISAKNVLLNVSTSDNVSFVYPSVPQVYLGDFEANSSKEVSFTFLATEYSAASTVEFYVTTASDSKTNYVVLSAPIKSETQAITVLSTNVPEEGYAYESITSSIYFRAAEEENLRNVELNVYVDDNLIATGLIGNISSGATKTQSISFVIENAGEHLLVFEIEGTDNNGTAQVVEAYKGNISIVKREVVSPDIDEDESLLIMNNRDKLVVLVSGVIILLCCIGIVFVIRKNN